MPMRIQGLSGGSEVIFDIILFWSASSIVQLTPGFQHRARPPPRTEGACNSGNQGVALSLGC